MTFKHESWIILYLLYLLWFQDSLLQWVPLDAELLKGVRWHSTIHLQNAAGHIKNATPGETCQLLSVRCNVPNSSCIIRRCKKIRKKFTDQASYEELQYVLPVLDTRGKRPILPVHLGRLCPGLNSCPVLALMYTSLDQSETATNSCSRSTRIPGHYPTYTAALAMSRPSGPRNWKLFFWVQGMNATPRLPELRLVVVVPLDLKTIAVLTFQIFACWFIASAQHRICIYGMCTMLAHMFLKGHNSTVYNGILRYASLKFMSCSSCFQLIVSIHCIHPDIVDTYTVIHLSRSCWAKSPPSGGYPLLPALKQHLGLWDQ